MAVDGHKWAIRDAQRILKRVAPRRGEHWAAEARRWAWSLRTKAGKSVEEGEPARGKSANGEGAEGKRSQAEKGADLGRVEEWQWRVTFCRRNEVSW